MLSPNYSLSIHERKSFFGLPEKKNNKSTEYKSFWNFWVKFIWKRPGFCYFNVSKMRFGFCLIGKFCNSNRTHLISGDIKYMPYSPYYHLQYLILIHKSRIPWPAIQIARIFSNKDIFSVTFIECFRFKILYEDHHCSCYCCCFSFFPFSSLRQYLSFIGHWTYIINIHVSQEATLLLLAGFELAIGYLSPETTRD